MTDRELDSIWDLAKWPPTAANVQPLRVLYVRTPEGRERLVRHMCDGNKAKTATAPAVAVLAVDTDFHQHIPQVLPFRPELKDVFDADETMRTETMRFSGALQAGYFLLAVRARGLAAGPMGGFDRDGLDAEFFPDGRWKSVLVVNIGHPGADPGSAGCRGWITPTSSGGPDRRRPWRRRCYSAAPPPRPRLRGPAPVSSCAAGCSGRSARGSGRRGR